jgi:hypothetical protein
MQTWLQNYAKGTTQSVEGGWTVDESLNGDTIAHVFTYYTTNGYSNDGDNLGGYNREHAGWVQYSNTVFPGIAIIGSSTVGGPQHGISMKFQLYQEPDGSFNWWVAVNNQWMGYYPATLFNGGLGDNVEWLSFGEEVYSSLANPDQTQDQMGSGYQANAGWGKTAFMFTLRNQTDLNGTMQTNNGNASSDTSSGTGTSPYTIQLFANTQTSETYFYGGGPAQYANPTATFDQITFDITTGGDDLRGDSSATASVLLQGVAQVFTLKAQADPGWPNNSRNVRTFQISGPAQPLPQFGSMTMTLTSHNSIFETDDNWDIENLSVSVSGPSGSSCLLNMVGKAKLPDGSTGLVRLTGSQPSASFQPGTGCP